MNSGQGNLSERMPTMEDVADKSGGWNGLPFYTHVTIAGLLIFALMLTVLSVLNLASGGLGVGEMVEGMVFYALAMIPTLVFVVLAWKTPSLTLPAAFWAMLMLLLIAPVIAVALGTFNSFFDTGLMVPVIVALIVAGVAGVVGFLQHRRGRARQGSTAGERWVLRATTVVVAGLMIVSGTLHLTSLESVSAAEKSAAISIDMKHSAFTPAQLTIPAGKPAKLVIKNGDLTVHTFTIEELGIDVKVLPGSEELVELSSPPAGTYVYLCTAGMVFSLPLHKPELESDPSVPNDTGTLVVRQP